MTKETSLMGSIHGLILRQIMLAGLILAIAATLYRHVQSFGCRKWHFE